MSVSESWAARTAFSIIVILALLGNAVVLWVFIRKHKRYNPSLFDVFIVNLALTDLVSAVFLIFSRFLYLPTMPDSQPNAFFLCHFLWGGYILFGLGYVSVYTCLLLTIERWLALNKPHLYRRLKAKHAIFSIIIVWIWAFFINSTVFISINENFQKRKCEWIEPKVGKAAFPVLELSFACVIPFSIIIALYCHIFYKFNRMATFSVDTQAVFKKRITIVALVASIALIVGWLPVKISFILRYTSVGGSHLSGTAHFIFIMMGLGNSCVNPILYGIYSSKFRQEYKEIAYGILSKKCTTNVNTDVKEESEVQSAELI